VTVGVSLAGFAAGAAAAMPILNPFSGNEVDDSRITDAWPRRSSAALGVSLAVQVGFVAVWMTRTSIPVAGTVPSLLIGLSAFAMGMQMNAIAPLPALLINASVLAIALRMPSPKPATAKLGQRPGRRVLAPLADAHTCEAAPPSHCVESPSHCVEPGQSR
jgi:hypothetical protein